VVVGVLLLGACASGEEGPAAGSGAASSGAGTVDVTATSTEPGTTPAPAAEPTAAPASEATTTASSIPATEAVTTAPAPTTTAAPAPSTMPPVGAVKVLVLNAGFKDGGASATADGLRAIGYQVLAPQNALEDRAASAVFFRTGWEPAAREVAERAGIAQDLVAPMPEGPLTDPQPSAYDVAVLLGRDRR
jgi:hypothetical protein